MSERKEIIVARAAGYTGFHLSHLLQRQADKVLGIGNVNDICDFLPMQSGDVAFYSAEGEGLMRGIDGKPTTSGEEGRNLLPGTVSITLYNSASVIARFASV